MRTVRMFGRTVTQYNTPMVVRVAHGAGEVFEAKVSGYTAEQAEAKALGEFRKVHPAAVVNGITSCLA